MMGFTMEQEAFIKSFIKDHKISRVAIIRQLLKSKANLEKDEHYMIDNAVTILSKMSDEEYSLYNFGVL